MFAGAAHTLASMRYLLVFTLLAGLAAQGYALGASACMEPGGKADVMLLTSGDAHSQAAMECCQQASNTLVSFHCSGFCMAVCDQPVSVRWRTPVLAHSLWPSLLPRHESFLQSVPARPPRFLV